MSFETGRVSFSRFLVNGKAPASADIDLLDILSRHAFEQTEIGAPPEVESGWVAGDHLFDTQFDFEKNVFGADRAAGAGTILRFAMRIDTNKVPPQIQRAFRQINEQAVAATNPSGFASRQQKQEARDLADRQAHEELASGKHRRSKLVPVFWDLTNRMLYCGAISNVAAEQLTLCMRRSFDVDIEALSAGTLAGEMVIEQGARRDYEDLQPTAFTATPESAMADHQDADGPRPLTIPSVPWTFKGGNTRDFLGNEWLIWLWWTIENQEGLATIKDHAGRACELAVHFDKALEMQCAWGATGVQTLKGHGPNRWPEAGEALSIGKWPRKAGLILADTVDGAQWELSLQADRWQISAAGLPSLDDAKVDSPRALLEARLALTLRLAGALDGLFAVFLKQRLSSAWPSRRDQIRQWIKQRRRGAKPAASLADAVPSDYTAALDVTAGI